jgi:hypothetical protein
VDAGVLVTPQLELSAQLSNTVKQANRMPYVRRSRWVEVQGAGSPWQFSAEELARRTYPALACCDEPLGGVNASVAAAPAAAAINSVSDSSNAASVEVYQGEQQQQLSLEQLLAMAAAGGSSAQQQCHAYNLVERNHTDVFLQQQVR